MRSCSRERRPRRMLAAKTMRKGRLNQPAAELAQRYSESVSFDWLLYPYDIAGSIAHAGALARAEIITTKERQQIEKELRVIEKEIESGKFEWDASLEDVHMNIEAALAKPTGPVGAKLHSARSRNDQIALDLRLYVKAEIAEVSGRLRSLQSALLNLVERHVDVVMPGHTHSQRAQPITFSALLAWAGWRHLSATRIGFVIASREQTFFHSDPERSPDPLLFWIANASRATSVFRV
jgi:argininosuccinate lyase